MKVLPSHHFFNASILEEHGKVCIVDLLLDRVCSVVYFKRVRDHLVREYFDTLHHFVNVVLSKNLERSRSHPTTGASIEG